MIEPEPSDFLAEERAKRYTYPPLIRVFRRVVGWLVYTLYFLGYDVSAWQLSTTPPVAKAQGMLFTFIRAVYGLLPDVKFPSHWQAHKDVLPRGPYLYYRDDLDPIAQANKLWETYQVNGGGGELPPVVDVEGINNSTLTASKIRACVERVHQLFGDVMIYTGYYVWRDEVTGAKGWASQYKLWLAAYPFTDWKPEYFELVKNYPPLIPAPWKAFDVWQFTSKLPALVYGVSGTYLDGNYCTEGFAQSYLTPPVEPPPPEEEPVMRFTNPTQINIRSSPASLSTNDVGDLPAGSLITALEVRPTDSNSVWVRFTPEPAWITKVVPEYWAAMVHDGQGPLLNFFD